MKKYFLIVLVSGAFIACNNAGDAADDQKDSLDSIAREQKQAIDSAADRRTDRIDSLTEERKDSIDREDSIRRNKNGDSSERP